jgi:uncharacterized protein (TIGR01777 family)
LDPYSVSGFDTVVHLAGEPVVGLWTAKKKQRILESRVKGTAELVEALAAPPRPPKRFLCASGINFYGNREDILLTDDACKGTGFLAEVCEAWERASQPIASVSNLANLRIGVVLDAQGGTLATMLPMFRLGLGAVVGRGDGFISWITLADLIRVIDHLIDTSGLSGSVNVVAPEASTSERLAREVASALQRLVHLRLPGWPFRLALGQLADETVLGSVRAVPSRLLEDGFLFEDVPLRLALQRCLRLLDRGQVKDLGQ